MTTASACTGSRVASLGAVPRQTLLWTIVLFFGASLAFGGLNIVTEGEPLGVRRGAQVLLLGVIIGAIVLIVRARG